jgi:hypothetical protein
LSRVDKTFLAIGLMKAQPSLYIQMVYFNLECAHMHKLHLYVSSNKLARL